MRLALWLVWLLCAALGAANLWLLWLDPPLWLVAHGMFLLWLGHEIHVAEEWNAHHG